jgi:CO/xanthine dehydrogenase Mo-binding subunit
MDLFLIQDSGAYGRRGDFNSAASIASLCYQPETMRFRGVPVITNTPPRGAQRAPGGAQAITMIGPVMDRGARELGVDRADMMYVNAPADQAFFHPGPTQLTSCYAKEAVQMGRELFNWDEKSQLSGQRNGTKVTGVGVAISAYSAGSSGYDGMLVIRPDGRLTIHSGVGNLGTHSVFDTSMAAAEVLGVPWDEVEVVWGDSSRGLPWSSSQGGSQTTHAHTRANYAAGLQAKRLLQEIAATDLGGAPENYDVGGGRVFRMGSPSVGLSFAEAASRAIELGGRYDGHELNESLEEMTVRAVQEHLTGEGLVAAATDEFSHEGATRSTVVAYGVVEIDTETGEMEVKEIVAVADCGTILNPRGVMAQVSGGMLQGMSQARFEKWGYDLRWGVNQNKRLHTAKPISIMNAPIDFQFAAVDIPDRETPIGSRGIGEPPVGAGAAVVLSAIQDAIGMPITRTPISPDKILNALEGGATGYTTLQTHV